MCKMQQYMYPLLIILHLLLISCTRTELTINELEVLLETDEYGNKRTQERTAIINDVIHIFSDASLNKSIHVHAAELLGELRAIEAVDILIARIVDVEYEYWDHAGRQYPCVPALIKIGKPASHAVLREIRKPMEDYRRLALARVLIAVEGPKVGLFMLEQEIADAKTPEERENLQKALKYFAE